MSIPFTGIPGSGVDLTRWLGYKIALKFRTTREYDLLAYLLKRRCRAPMHSYFTRKCEIEWRAGVPASSTGYYTPGDTLPTATNSRSTTVVGEGGASLFVTPFGYDPLPRDLDNGAPLKVYDDIEALTQDAMWAKRRWLAAQVWDGTGTGKEMLGLKAMIPAVATASQTGTLWGLSRASYGHLRSQYGQMTTYNFGTVAPGDTKPYGLTFIDDAISLCQFGTRIPSVMITTKAIFLNIRKAMESMSIATTTIGDKMSFEYGFDSFSYRGVEIMWDPRCPTDTFFLLHIGQPNDRAVELFGKPGSDLQKVDLTYYEGDGRSKSELSEEPGFVQFINPNAVNKLIGEANMLAHRRTDMLKWIMESWGFLPTLPAMNGRFTSDNGSRLTVY